MLRILGRIAVLEKGNTWVLDHMEVCTEQKMELGLVCVDIYIFSFCFYRMNPGEKGLVASQIK